MKKSILSLLFLVFSFSDYSQNAASISELEMKHVINGLSEYYNSQNFTKLPEILSGSLKVFEFPNKLRNSNLNEVIAHWEKTFET